MCLRHHWVFAFFDFLQLVCQSTVGEEIYDFCGQMGFDDCMTLAGDGAKWPMFIQNVYILVCLDGDDDSCCLTRRRPYRAVFGRANPKSNSKLKSNTK